MQILLEHGPLLTKDEIERRARKMGVGIGSFWHVLSFSPMITRYARGVFGLVGADVIPGEIEALIKNSRKTDVLKDHGWTANGRIWIAYRLSRAAATSGVISVPSGKREMVQGRFQLADRSARTIGTLVVAGTSCSGLATILRKSGAEAGDYLVVEIDTLHRKATAQIGDESLLEEYAAP